MNKSIMKTHNLLKIINNSFIALPSPINISYWWNMGSLLGICLMMQILTGLFLSMHYCPNLSLAFNSVIHIMQNINFGWLMRLIHLNGASLFFFCLYLHIGRGIYYKSYNLKKAWNIGVIIFLSTMATAFMGYVLPWGQMSFWGAMVITNLISTIPLIGQMIVEWVWGGFSINNPTLNRFYSLHFIMPFMILSLVIIHLMMIHETGSNNPLGVNSNMYKIIFHSYFTWKDLFGMMIMLMMLFIIIFKYPLILTDPENYIPANPLKTPIHIQPEWYFLFAYAILRSIPNKLGGVMALLMSILILMVIPMINKSKFQSMKFYPINQFLFWMFVNIFILLIWLGMMPVEAPYIIINQICTTSYFMFYFINPILMKWWDKLNF